MCTVRVSGSPEWMCIVNMGTAMSDPKPQTRENGEDFLG